MKQVTLAERMGIAQPHVSNLEKGLRGWTVPQLVRAAAALDVDPGELISWREPLTPAEVALIEAARTGDAGAILAAMSAAVKK